VAIGIALGAAMGGTMMVPVGDMARQSHVPTRDFQELCALGRVAQPLGGPQATRGHSLVSFTRGHNRPSTVMSDFKLAMRHRGNGSLAVRRNFPVLPIAVRPRK
jgi:hypothetical protein